MERPPVTSQTRRSILKSLLFALPAFMLFKRVKPLEKDDVVEVAGWILKRSDLA